MQQAVETATGFIRMDEEGILRLTIKDDARVDEEEVKKIFDVIRELSKGNHVLELIEGGTFFTFSQAAQQYAAKHGKDLFIASALVNKSIAVRLLFNFFNSFFKHPVPFKMFADETQALNWLKKYKE